MSSSLYLVRTNNEVHPFFVKNIDVLRSKLGILYGRELVFKVKPKPLSEIEYQKLIMKWESKINPNNPSGYWYYTSVFQSLRDERKVIFFKVTIPQTIPD